MVSELQAGDREVLVALYVDGCRRKLDRNRSWWSRPSDLPIKHKVSYYVASYRLRRLVTMGYAKSQGTGRKYAHRNTDPAKSKYLYQITPEGCAILNKEVLFT